MRRLVAAGCVAFHTKNVEAKVDYEKKDVAVLNRRARNKKVGEKALREDDGVHS